MTQDIKSIQLNRRAFNYLTVFLVTFVSIALIALILRFTILPSENIIVILLSIFGGIGAATAMVFFTCTAKVKVDINKDFIQYESIPASLLNFHKRKKIIFSWSDVRAWRQSSYDEGRHRRTDSVDEFEMENVIELAVEQHGLIELWIMNQKIDGKPAGAYNVLTVLLEWMSDQPQNLDDFYSYTDPGLMSAIITLVAVFTSLGLIGAALIYGIYTRIQGHPWSSYIIALTAMLVVSIILYIFVGEPSNKDNDVENSEKPGNNLRH